MKDDVRDDILNQNGADLPVEQSILNQNGANATQDDILNQNGTGNTGSGGDSDPDKDKGWKGDANNPKNA